MKILAFWKNLTIAKKLYSVVGIMALLIVSELAVLRFAMHNLSAARAFVGGESLWSKAQKNAVFSLQRFGHTKNESDFRAFIDHLKINDGDHQARMELSKPNPDLNKVRQGFIQGHIHEQDVEPIVQLIQRFSWISYLQRAIQVWTKGDELLAQLRQAGVDYHSAVLNGDAPKAEDALSRIKSLNEELTTLEEQFSSALGEGSRWLENLVLSLLTIAVLTVESIGLSLAFITTRAISRGLTDLSATAKRIGDGDFDHKVKIHSNDEIGQLGTAVNAMGEMLQKSYSELERRVEERTAELMELADENAKLYQQANAAVEARDEFISIASHELKTPLTALYLQLQLLNSDRSTNLQEKIETSTRLAKRLATLLDELLDLTRLRIGKFELRTEFCDLASIVRDVVSQFSAEAARAGSSISLRASEPIFGHFDRLRVGQIVTNLISNSIKYGNAKPIEIVVEKVNAHARVCVIDKGIGIPDNQKNRIFERFKRGTSTANQSGLGLGLYITQQIVKAHGGEISVESVPQKGSTFTISLKAA